MGLLDDIKIYFKHYRSEEEALKEWYERLKRFNWDNIYVKMTIQDERQAKRFDKLSFKNKVAFTDHDFKLKSCVYLNGWADPNIQRRYEAFWAYAQTESNKYFDFVKWLNGI